MDRSSSKEGLLARVGGADLLTCVWRTDVIEPRQPIPDAGQKTGGVSAFIGGFLFCSMLSFKLTPHWEGHLLNCVTCRKL